MSGWRRWGEACKINMTWFPAVGSYKIGLEKDNWVWNFMRTVKCWRDKCMQQNCRKEEICKGDTGRKYSTGKGVWIRPQEDFLLKRVREEGVWALQESIASRVSSCVKALEEKAEKWSGCQVEENFLEKLWEFIYFHLWYSLSFLSSFFICSLIVFHKYILKACIAGHQWSLTL